MSAPFQDNVRPLRRPAGTAQSADRRVRANWQAELRTGATAVACTVTDVSSMGACLRVELPQDNATQLWLQIEKAEAPILAAVAWQKKNRTGLRFLEEQKWVLQVHSQRFDPSAWLKNYEMQSRQQKSQASPLPAAREMPDPEGSAPKD